MPVHFFVPGPLRDFAEGRSRVDLEISPRTLAEALDALGAKYPGVARRVLDERGEVTLDHLASAMLGEGLATPIPDDCEIAILPAVSGG